MLIRLTVMFLVSTLLVWWSPLLEIWQIYLFIGLAGFGVFGLFPLNSGGESQTPEEADKVVSLPAFRKQRERRQREEATTKRPQLEMVYESQFIYEADMTASMLEQHGIATHILNRHSAGILVHPTGEMTIKVLVSHHEQPQALRLIEKYRSRSFPEDSSIA